MRLESRLIFICVVIIHVPSDLYYLFGIIYAPSSAHFSLRCKQALEEYSSKQCVCAGREGEGKLVGIKELLHVKQNKIKSIKCKLAHGSKHSRG